MFVDGAEIPASQFSVNVDMAKVTSMIPKDQLPVSELRIVRLGYAPVTVKPLTEVALRGIVMIRIPALLATMAVVAKPVCAGEDGRPEALRAWELARSGLLATIVAREQLPAAVTSFTFSRALHEPEKLVIEQRTRREIGRRVHSAARIPPVDLS